MCAKTDRARRAGGGGRAGAFTLIELLLVMFVMTVLVALVVGVGTYVMEDGKKRETQMAQTYLMRAIDEYYKITSRYPPDREGASGEFLTTVAYDPAKSVTLLYAYLVGDKGDYAAAVRSATQPYMDQVNGSMTDGFGKAMRYYLLGATSDTNKKPVGGKPLIVSAGPDRWFGDESATPIVQQRRRKDNIRSDGRTNQ